MTVEFEVDDGIAVITMNRPERLNAMDSAAYKALSEAWTAVRDDEDIRVAVITGAGAKSFSTGADLKSFFGRDKTLTNFWRTQEDQLLNRGLEVWKPIVAAVNGYCIGGGMTLLLATDIRVASETATFGLSEVKRGVIAGNGGTQRVLEQLPHPLAMELLLTGKHIDAETALQWGLINRVVPPGQLIDAAMELADEIKRNAPLAVQAAKELAIRSREMDRVTGLRFEQTINRLLQFTDDAKEGPAAFAERREPTFRAR